MKEDIHPQTQILIDEDVSIEKLQFLITLGVEEERLDFKQTFDFSDKIKAKKSKIDLIADIIAMTNTDGGYIVVGIGEHSKSEFKIEGLNEECIKQITQENIVNFLGNYTETLPKVIVKCHVLDTKKVVLIYVGNSRVMIPFKTDGQFGNNERKFSSGDIFVRHGSISIKANYEDMRKYAENVRHDERKMLNLEGKGTAQILNRLDKLIEIFTGNTPSYGDFDIGENSLESIADYIFNLSLDAQKLPVIKRAISKYFRTINLHVTKLFEEGHDKETAEKIRLDIPPMLEKIIPIWSSLSESDNNKVLLYLSDQIYDLWALTFKLGDNNKIENRLIVQTEIIQVVYVCIAFSIKNGNVEPAKSLIKRKAEVDLGEHRRCYWFRYILTWLSRTRQLKVASLIYLTNESFKDNDFIETQFGSNEVLLKFLAQADFIQCVNTYADKELDYTGFWPSYRLHKKTFIIPIIDDIIDNNNNKWVDTTTDEEIVKFWKYSESFQAPEVQRNWSWHDYNVSSKSLNRLIEKVDKKN